MKVCETCGKELVRKRHANGQLEANRSFNVRRFCDRRCRSETWRETDLRVLAIAYPYFPAPLIAKGLGRTPSSIRQKAKELEMRQTARGRSNSSKWAQALRTDRPRRTA